MEEKGKESKRKVKRKGRISKGMRKGNKVKGKLRQVNFMNYN